MIIIISYESEEWKRVRENKDTILITCCVISCDQGNSKALSHTVLNLNVQRASMQPTIQH